jgi:hypothetical protein
MKVFENRIGVYLHVHETRKRRKTSFATRHSRNLNRTYSNEHFLAEIFIGVQSPRRLTADSRRRRSHGGQFQMGNTYVEFQDGEVGAQVDAAAFHQNHRATYAD